MPDGSALAIAAIVGLKYLLPLAIIPFPFLAGWANFVLDSVDGDMLLPLGLSDGVYQRMAFLDALKLASVRQLPCPGAQVEQRLGGWTDLHGCRRA